MVKYGFNPFTSNFDQILSLDNPVQFKGSISIASDFPTSAEVKNGWFYKITVDVTDDDSSKTNTGDSFFDGDEIIWDGTGWVVAGNELIYVPYNGATGDVDLGENALLFNDNSGDYVGKIYGTTVASSYDQLRLTLRDDSSQVILSDATVTLVSGGWGLTWQEGRGLHSSNTPDFGASSQPFGTGYINNLDFGTNTITDGEMTGDWSFNGNIGIGTTTPATKLEINSTSVQMRLSYDDTNYADVFTDDNGSLIVEPTNSEFKWRMGVGDFRLTNYFFYTPSSYAFRATTGYLAFSTDQAGNSITFATGGYSNKRMTIDGNGDIGIGTTTPLAQLHTTKGRIVNTTRVITTYTILTTDHHIFCNTDAGDYTVTLPIGIEGQTFKIINSGNTVHNLTLTPNGTEYLLGKNDSFLLMDGETLNLTYNGDDGWY